jgi:hypothetical protein
MKFWHSPYYQFKAQNVKHEPLSFVTTSPHSKVTTPRGGRHGGQGNNDDLAQSKLSHMIANGYSPLSPESGLDQDEPMGSLSPADGPSKSKSGDVVINMDGKTESR